MVYGSGRGNFNGAVLGFVWPPLEDLEAFLALLFLGFESFLPTTATAFATESASAFSDESQSESPTAVGRGRGSVASRLEKARSSRAPGSTIVRCRRRKEGVRK